MLEEDVGTFMIRGEFPVSDGSITSVLTAAGLRLCWVTQSGIGRDLIILALQREDFVCRMYELSRLRSAVESRGFLTSFSPYFLNRCVELALGTAHRGVTIELW